MALAVRQQIEQFFPPNFVDGQIHIRIGINSGLIFMTQAVDEGQMCETLYV